MNLPHDFESYTRQLMGEQLYSQLAAGLDSTETPVSIRLNPFKAGDNDIAEDLRDTDVPWCKTTGRYLSRRPNFTFDPLLHAGVYYVQEAASMFIDYVVRLLVKHPILMLDLCAAPGGKSTALRSALPDGSLLFSNEPMRTRAQILSENLQKFGHEDIIVTNNYPRDYHKARLTFDAILADVPCSGEGMFRKDDGARSEWSLQNVDNCWQLQREIVSDIWSCLRPGGLLFYSTCTFNAHEDEENVEWIARELGADFVGIPVDPSWCITPAIVGSAPVYRFMPGVSRSEGLFLAVLRKHTNIDNPKTISVEEACICIDNKSLSKSANNDNEGKKLRKEKRKNSKPNAKQLSANINIPLTNAADFTLRNTTERIYAIPSRWTGTYDNAAKSLKILHAGVCLGTEKGKDIIPDQSLALSRRLDPIAYPHVSLDYADAVGYLRKEAAPLPDDTQRGFVVVCYKDSPLGFAKNIGNRANNLYPQEWRIKSSHVPEQECVVVATEHNK